MREETHSVFYAIDGSCFYTREECEEYEKNSPTCRIHSVPHSFVNSNEIPPYTLEKSDYILCLFPRNLVELEAIKNWFSMSTFEELNVGEEEICNAMLFGVSVYPTATWKDDEDITIGDIEGVYCYYGNTQEFMEKITKTISKLMIGALSNGKE